MLDHHGIHAMSGTERRTHREREREKERETERERECAIPRNAGTYHGVSSLLAHGDDVIQNQSGLMERS